MFKAIKLTEENLPLLNQFVRPLVYRDYKTEFELNAEEGIETYAIMQDYKNSDGKVLVYLIAGDFFQSAFRFIEPESTTEFKDILTN